MAFKRQLLHLYAFLEEPQQSVFIWGNCIMTSHSWLDLLSKQNELPAVNHSLRWENKWADEEIDSDLAGCVCVLVLLVFCECLGGWVWTRSSRMLAFIQSDRGQVLWPLSQSQLVSGDGTRHAPCWSYDMMVKLPANTHAWNMTTFIISLTLSLRVKPKNESQCKCLEIYYH